MKKLKKLKDRELEQSRQQRLDSILKDQKVIYCKDNSTAINSLSKIFDLTIEQCQTAINSIPGKIPLDDSLDFFSKIIFCKKTPSYDGAFYFHGTRTPKSNRFIKGLLPLHRKKFPKMIANIIGEKSPDLRREYLKNISWYNIRHSDDKGPCGTQYLSSLFDMDYFNKSEAITDSMYYADTKLKKDVMDIFNSRTVTKLVTFYSKWVECPDLTLQALINFLRFNKTKQGHSLPNMEKGFDARYAPEHHRVTHKHIVGLEIISLPDDYSKDRTTISESFKEPECLAGLWPNR